MFPKNIEHGIRLLEDIRKESKKALAQHVEVVACPPVPFLSFLKQKFSTAIHFGAQDVSPYTEEAKTGCVSVAHLVSSGAAYVILGHSEMRFRGETSEQVGEKVSAAVKGGLRAILCVGESVRNTDGKNFLEVEKQLRECLVGFPGTKTTQLIIAYEPVWAVGKEAISSALPRELEEMHMLIRRVLAEQFGKTKAFRIPIIYGGSVDPKNISSYMAITDGVLVGRKSLRAKDFIEIIQSAVQCSRA